VISESMEIQRDLDLLNYCT